jgi:ATPase family associated with various cellular activities (AAA)
MAGPRSRIVIVGTTGVGKSMLAKRLVDRLGLEFIELDALHWGPNWKAASVHDFRIRTDEATSAEGWVVAGNYRQVRDIVWSRADTLVWLDYSFPRALWRLTRRTVRRAVTREVLWNGNRESFWEHFKFWSEVSVYYWLFKGYGPRRREYPVLFSRPEYAHLKIVRLKSPRATEQWLGRFSSERPIAC